MARLLNWPLASVSLNVGSVHTAHTFAWHAQCIWRPPKRTLKVRARLSAPHSSGDGERDERGKGDADAHRAAQQRAQLVRTCARPGPSGACPAPAFRWRPTWRKLSKIARTGTKRARAPVVAWRITLRAGGHHRQNVLPGSTRARACCALYRRGHTKRPQRIIGALVHPGGGALIHSHDYKNTAAVTLAPASGGVGAQLHRQLAAVGAANCTMMMV